MEVDKRLKFCMITTTAVILALLIAGMVYCISADKKNNTKSTEEVTVPPFTDVSIPIGSGVIGYTDIAGILSSNVDRLEITVNHIPEYEMVYASLNDIGDILQFRLEDGHLRVFRDLDSDYMNNGWKTLDLKEVGIDDVSEFIVACITDFRNDGGLGH